MLEPLKIKQTDTSPKVDFNAETGTLLISGRSLMEDSVKFYTPLLQWIDKYLENPKKLTTIILEMDYFNSSSARMLAKVLIKFEKLAEQPDYEVKVIWRYKANDDIMKERGQEFKTIIYLPFELEEIQPEEI